MYPQRDALGSAHRLAQYRAGEPSPASEAVHSTPRQKNVRFTASTGLHETTNKGFAPLNPDKVTSAQPYTSGTAPRRRKLPQPPSPEKQRSRDFVQVRERHYEPDGAPTPQSSTREQFPAYSGPNDEIDTSRPARQPLSQASIGSRPFHDPVPALIRLQDPDSKRPPWYGTYGYSEREPVGKLPMHMVGKHSEQIKDFHNAQEFVTSLRVENNEKKAEEQWWRPLSVRDKRENAGTSGASSPTPSARFTTHDDMPSVFRRLTDPKRFNGTHKHRFAEDGVGMGLEGRREDDSHQTVIAGKAVITRDIDPEMDAPNKPMLSSRNSSRASSRPSTRPSSRARVSRGGSMPDVFERLTKPAVRAGDGLAQYETKVKVENQYGVVRDAIPRWQSGM